MAGRRRSDRAQQGGSAWTGSIQQDLIEKLWVAILTFDSSPSSVEAASQAAAKSEDSESDDSSLSDDDDEDVELSDGDGGVALVNRCDLFSVAARRMQESEESTALPSKNDSAGDDRTERKTHAETLMSTSLQLQVDEKIDRPLPRPISLSLRNVSSKPSKIPQLSPLSPTISLAASCSGGATAAESTDVFSQKNLPVTAMASGKKFTSKIPLSPSLRRKMLQPRERLASDPTPKRSTVKVLSNEIATCSRRALTPDPKPFKQRPRGISVHKPVDMTRSTGGRESDRKISRPGTNRSNNINKEDGSRINSSNSSRYSLKGKPESDKNSRVKQTQRGSISNVQKAVKETKSRVLDIPKRIIMGNVKKSAQEKKIEGSTRRTLGVGDGNVSGTAQAYGTAKMNKIANKEEQTRDKEFSRMKNERKGLNNVGKENITEKNKSAESGDTTKGKHVREVNKPSTQQRFRDQRLSPKPNERRQSTKHYKAEFDISVERHPKRNTEPPRQIRKRKEEQRTCVRSSTRSQTKERTQEHGVSNDRETDSKGTSNSTDKKTKSSCAANQGAAADTGNSQRERMEPSCLESCLKEAILGVLQGLPEGWILVPDHTAELFSSLTSVVDSFPRPLHAHIRVVEAIMDAHARRPCSKGEIPALNNAHLLLYIALKLCCVRGQHQEQENEENGQVPPDRCVKENEAQSQIVDGKLTQIGVSNVADGEWTKEHKSLVVKILNEVLECEGSFDRLMMCLLLGSRAPGRGSGWYCESESENEKVLDLCFVLNHAKFLPGCRVSEVVSAPLWSCGSTPVVVAALAESPRLVLTLLQYGAGGSTLNYYLYSKCYTDGVYLSIAYLVRKLEGQFREVYAAPELLQPTTEEDLEDQQQETPESSCVPKDDLLNLAGNSPTATCLRYLLRAVPQVPPKFLRDHVSGCLCDAPSLLPRSCCLDPPSLAHLARVACRRDLRSRDLLPHAVDLLDIPSTLRDAINLLRG
ncbi:uncharacterized protein LOC122257030 [Penaeus japonicus]|uniref:uncharacterized protein LOC122257030 n=1 Tax=Penaeus japonicus TaxID=27405 RepID=UPI001C716EDD|nr:uncharacterized protein LOC122257030 [Penaeus japonicus]